MECDLPMDPPINNLIQPNIYDRLNAISCEKARVANSQLNSRLQIQERIINKYRKDAERVFNKQSYLAKRELRKIRKKRPESLSESELAHGSRLPRSDFSDGKTGSRLRSLSETSDCSYCKRYYAHHYNVREKKTPLDDNKLKRHENDFFNAKLRCLFMSLMSRAFHHTPADEDGEYADVFSETHSEVYPLPGIRESRSDMNEGEKNPFRGIAETRVVESPHQSVDVIPSPRQSENKQTLKAVGNLQTKIPGFPLQSETKEKLQDIQDISVGKKEVASSGDTKEIEHNVSVSNRDSSCSETPRESNIEETTHDSPVGIRANPDLKSYCQSNVEGTGPYTPTDKRCTPISEGSTHENNVEKVEFYILDDDINTIPHRNDIGESEDNPAVKVGTHRLGTPRAAERA